MNKLPDFFSPSTREWFAECLGEPTKVQSDAWPEIEAGHNTLVSAPTGTGKTLTAFLVYIDQMLRQSQEGELKEELQVIYISPLKSLAADIRENLNRPLEGIWKREMKGDPHLVNQVRVSIRTGDTTEKERRDMIKHPPHILITTPESLFLLLTSKSGRGMITTAHTVILDELHVMIDTKRGAHLMLSLARLDALCGRSLQRIGLSATMEPLSVAAEYLSPDQVSVVAPLMEKKVQIQVRSPKRDESLITKDSVWRDIAMRIYEECQKARSVITFVEGRKAAEQLALYMRELGGEDFARVHHGSLSKEQRCIVEQDLKNGRIRLLIATSSMELGIDVGEIDQVFQVGMPHTISGTMQRLGRAGHSPNKTSVMLIYPRTAEEALYCGLTAQVARQGGIEHLKPPALCLDILAQHLVSIAANREYEVSEVMPILQRAKPFFDVTMEDVRAVLRMLAGDYEHEENVPVRPRLLYDRIHDRVEVDSYSRMLATSAGGTIPDRGMYVVKTESGVKVGEVEEEFVFECRVGDEFQLGSFHWRIQKITRDTMFVIPSAAKRDRLPFWKGDIFGRRLTTGMAFGAILRELEEAYHTHTLEGRLKELGLDEECVRDAAEYIDRQIKATQVLPNDQRILLEHYQDEEGNHQLMIHSVFGNCVNAPLALLLQEYAAEQTKATINYVSDDDGIVLYPYDGQRLPSDMLYHIDPNTAKAYLEAMVMGTPTFNIMFRYNAGRALMMGINRQKRQPLWIQRIRGAQMLERAIAYADHPLIRETKRECLEDFWDIDGLTQVLTAVQNGEIQVIEQYDEIPSPMSFLLRKKTEESLMYNYAPTPGSVLQTTGERLKEVKGLLAPDEYQLKKIQERRELPADERKLHTLLMIEGDLVAGELELPVEWFELLLQKEQILYREPGLWIPAEQKEEYEKALDEKEQAAREKLLLRLLRYRGDQTSEEIALRYLFSKEETEELLDSLMKKDQVIAYEGSYYHKELFDRARTATVKSRRELVVTREFAGYVSYLSGQKRKLLPPTEQLEQAIESLCGQFFAMDMWETVLLPARVNGYRSQLLDTLLSQGKYYWKIKEGKLCFLRYEEADWDTQQRLSEGIIPNQTKGAALSQSIDTLDQEQLAVLHMLQKRGACFANALSQAIEGASAYSALIGLAKKGLVCTDSFGPVRYLLKEESIEKMVEKQKAKARILHLSSGRWDFSRERKAVSLEVTVERALELRGILCRETAKELLSWQQALEVLRIWEYVGKVRRGYFVQGMSGIQFVLAKEFPRLMEELTHPALECRWLSALDPALGWGKYAPHCEGRAFQSVAGTCVALVGGRVVAVMERKGKVFKVYEPEYLALIIKTFAQEYLKKTIYTDCKRIVVKEYPIEAGELLHENGFKKVMMDYELYL